MLTGNFMKLK